MLLGGLLEAVLRLIFGPVLGSPPRSKNGNLSDKVNGKRVKSFGVSYCLFVSLLYLSVSVRL